jgi:hypothetical protein
MYAAGPIMFVLLVCIQLTEEQTLDASAANSRIFVQNSNSVDIQLCALGILPENRVSFQQAALKYLQQIVTSDAVYIINQFTTASSAVCFVYVFQATNPSIAQQAFALLSMLSPAQVVYMNTQWPCTVTASPWQDITKAPFGVPLPFQWSANDLLLWGLCGGAVMSCIAIFFCICIIRTSFDDVRACMARVDRDETVLLKALNTASIPKPVAKSESKAEHKEDPKKRPLKA